MKFGSWKCKKGHVIWVFFLKTFLWLSCETVFGIHSKKEWARLFCDTNYCWSGKRISFIIWTYLKRDGTFKVLMYEEHKSNSSGNHIQNNLLSNASKYFINFFKDFEACPCLSLWQAQWQVETSIAQWRGFIQAPRFAGISIIPPILHTRLYLRSSVTRSRKGLIVRTFHKTVYCSGIGDHWIDTCFHCM